MGSSGPDRHLTVPVGATRHSRGAGAPSVGTGFESSLLKLLTDLVTYATISYNGKQISLSEKGKVAW